MKTIAAKYQDLATPRGGTITTATTQGTVWFLLNQVPKLMGGYTTYTVEKDAIRLNKSFVQLIVDVKSTRQGQPAARKFVCAEVIQHLCHEADHFKDIQSWVEDLSGWTGYMSKPKGGQEEDTTMSNTAVVVAAMENRVIEFYNEQFGVIRSVVIDDEPWFVAADMCKVLGLDKVWNALQRLDDDEKGTTSISTLGGRQEMSIVNEPGLYSLILGSRKSEAKAFKRWVTHDVLPTIRKTGGYVSEVDKFVEAYFPGADKTTKSFLIQSLKETEKQKRINKELDLANKALYADNSTWDDRTIMGTLIPYIARKRGTTIPFVYKELYSEAVKRYHFDLIARRKNYRGDDKRPIVSFANDEELHCLARLAATLAYRYDVDMVKALNPVNAAYAKNLIREDEAHGEVPADWCF